MRLCFLNHNLSERGTYFRCLQLGRHLVARGHSVSLLTTAADSRTRSSSHQLDGVEVLEFPSLLPGSLRSGFDPVEVVRRRRRLGGEQFDLVHAFDCRPTVIHPARALRRSGIPLVIDWADLWARGGAASERHPRWLNRIAAPLETFYEEHFRRCADGQTAINGVLAERARSLAADGAPVHLLRSGAALEEIEPLDRLECRGALGWPAERPTAVFAGYAPYDVELLLRSHLELGKLVPSAHLVIAGTMPQPLRRRVASLSSESIELLGAVPFSRLPILLGAADVLLLPYGDRLTNRGRWPHKLGDYLAAGRPLVTNPTGELAKQFAGQEFARLAPETPEGMAAEIAHVLAAPDRAAAWGRQARRYAEEYLDWAPIATGLEGFYEEVLSRALPA